MDNNTERICNLEKQVQLLNIRNENLQKLCESLATRLTELEEQHAILLHDDNLVSQNNFHSTSHAHQGITMLETESAKDINENSIYDTNTPILASFDKFDNLANSRAEWRFLDKKLIPNYQSIPKSFNETVNALVLSLTPSKFSEIYRESIRAFILRQISDIPPGVKVYFQGLHVLDCYLPNDTIRLSLFFWPGHIYKVNWYLSLNEVLTTLVEDGPDESPDKCYDGSLDSCVMEHGISNIAYSQKSKALLMQLDGFVDLEIKADNCEEFILLALVEEFSLLLGKPKLLKDSIILIRAWWFYESKSFLQHKDVKDLLLTDYSLLVMICAVLNQYYKEVSTPFEVLCYFLGIYSSFDYESHFITIHGIKPFCAINSLSTSPSIYHMPSPDLMLTSEVMMKYWSLHMENVNADESAKDETTSGPNYLEIERASLNILHPLKNSNKTSANTNKRKANYIFNCFANGATKMQEGLIQASRGNYSLIENLFNRIFLLFRNLRVPDTILEKCNRIARPLNPKKIILMELTEQIDFCNLVLHRHLTTNGLLCLVKDIITERGPLPIGEIGKTLNMTNLIKDKFGGLKKFLETYQNIFIISSNHAYNPHVFVRCNLDSIELASIENGEFSELLLKGTLKNHAGSSNKKKKKTKAGEGQLPTSTPGIAANIIFPPDNQRNKSNALGDRYFFPPENGTSVSSNFNGINYGMNGSRVPNGNNTNMFGQSLYSQNAGLLGSRENTGHDVLNQSNQSSFLFNNFDSNQVGSGSTQSFLNDNSSRWDIYRNNSNINPELSSSSFDMNFLNYDSDIHHLLSGTSLGGSSPTIPTTTTGTESKLNSLSFRF